MRKLSLGKGLGSLIPKKPLSEPSLLNNEQAAPEGLKFKKESIFNVETERIRPNPNQPRQKFFPDSLKELADSIKEHGIIQPLLVDKIEKETPTGRQVEYQLIAGERRWRAAQIAGLPHVPVVIRDSSEKEKLEISLIENIQRENLNPIETAKAYRQLNEDFGMKHADIGKRVGKNRPTVSNTMRLLELPDKIQKAIESGDIYEGHARALISVKDPEQKMQFFEKCIAEKWSVRQIEDKIRMAGVFTPPKQRIAKRDPIIIAYERQLTHHFSTKVNIRQRDKAGRLMLDFYSQKELDDLVDRLSRA